MISNARGSHSSPGIYTKEVDLSYAAKSLGITTLGVVGETLKGPAFEPIKIENWREFQTYFGGTSAEKFAGSQYPKYELPYIAKSYLKNSNQLEVCRVLGLSGYNAGPAWLITASGDDNKRYVVAVLRSRGSYNEYGTGEYDPCNLDTYEYDVLNYFTKKVSITGYTSVSTMINCSSSSTSSEDTYDINVNNYGRFTLIVTVGYDKDDKEINKNYPVSLNPSDKDYILNVLGTSNQDGEAPIFVEELYDIALFTMISDGVVTKIDDEIKFVNEGLNVEYIDTDETNPKKFTPKIPNKERVSDFKTLDNAELTIKNVGKRFVSSNAVEVKVKVHANTNEEYRLQDGEMQNNEGYVFKTKQEGDTFVIDETQPVFTEKTQKRIVIYTVKSKIEEGRRVYNYEIDSILDEGERVYIIAKNAFYEVTKTQTDEVVNYNLVICSNDVNDYKEQFRCASTPWIVSELKGDGNIVDMKKLFRFHTISDGNTANSEVKVSIQNIRPNEGLFDVLVRAFDDMDSNPIVIERFSKCSMVPGTSNFIGLKIGTFDGEYEIKSKYITVEVIANDMTESCVPAGFLGYPMREMVGVEKPLMGYNVYVNEDIKAKKQYFGFSNITGVDVDLFKYKGRNAYDNKNSLSEGFHLDSRIEAISNINYSVDGENGFNFITVNPNNTTGINGGAIPVIGLENEMAGTIYEDINLRKFTVCFYGGFDGWDIYRTSRTNTDKYKANKYKGVLTNGNGSIFNQIYDTDGLNLTGKCITSDYYAYLAGIRQFMNPEAVDINIFATPGIDYVNNTLLSSEALTMIEEDRGDALYIMTTPDKPFGNGDNDMYYPDEVVENLFDTEIDSSYAATYYPWVKYYDNDNKVYINLPATKDVVRSLAYTDNTSYPWFAPAGIIRGGVECERAHFITKLEDEDTLYDGMINPIKTFATDGVKIWGQKTMYGEDTPLNRINVRRLMLRVKKLITGACRRLIFEQNDATVKAQFEGLVKPILDDIKAKRGIYDYRLEVQDSPEARDRMELPAVIYIKPTKALEYIDLTFVIAPESVSFDE